MQTVYVTTNGCDEGQLKSMHVQQYFVKNGFVVTKDPAQADYVVFYACGLTNEKEKESIQMLKRLQAATQNSAKFVLWGCLTKQNPKCLSGIYDGPLIGPRDINYFETLLGKRFKLEDVSGNTLDLPGKQSEDEVCPKLAFDPVADILSHLKENVEKIRLPSRKWLFDADSYFIRVSEGCTGKCTYCSERLAWGRAKSKPIQKIVDEFNLGLQRGYKRFFLVAADLGPYGIDIGSNLVELLQILVKLDEEKDYQIILNQMNPVDLIRLLPGLESVLASGKIEALGCQVESGSDRILQLMQRGYRAKDWRDCMLRINKKFPSVRLSTHIIIGFPSETEKDFAATIKLLDFPIFIDWVGFFLFSPRPTVYASRLPGQVPQNVKNERFKKIYRKYLYMNTLNIIIGNLHYYKSKITQN